MISISLLKKLRKMKDYRQIDVANFLGFKTPTAYYKVERGRRPLTLREAKQLCELYRVSWDELLANSDPVGPPVRKNKP